MVLNTCKPSNLIEGVVFLDIEKRKTKAEKCAEIDSKVKEKTDEILSKIDIEAAKKNVLKALDSIL